jgi:hypothetical protein
MKEPEFTGFPDRDETADPFSGHLAIDETLAELKRWRNELIVNQSERDTEGILFAWRMLDNTLDEYLEEKVALSARPYGLKSKDERSQLKSAPECDPRSAIL